MLLLKIPQIIIWVRSLLNLKSCGFCLWLQCLFTVEVFIRKTVRGWVSELCVNSSHSQPSTATRRGTRPPAPLQRPRHPGPTHARGEAASSTLLSSWWRRRRAARPGVGKEEEAAEEEEEKARRTALAEVAGKSQRGRSSLCKTRPGKMTPDVVHCVSSRSQCDRSSTQTSLVRRPCRVSR